MEKQPLVRAVGLFSLTALAINGMVGSGIFVLPAQVAAILGPAALSAYLIAGLSVALVVLCFAEVASLFATSGGPYVYARAAFGDFIGFQIGWMMLAARVTSIGAISNAFASYLGFFWPVLASGPGRVIAITTALAILTAVNYRGVKYGARVNDLLTVSKMVPLFIFVVAGLFFLDPTRPSPFTPPDPAGLRTAGLLLVFAFGGFEFAAVPGAEIVNPRRNLPIAMLTAIAFVIVLYLAIQFVAQGTLPDLKSSATPLATASRRFLGPLGGALLTAGAVISTMGTNSGIMLIGPRIIYGMAEGHQLPSVFARVHSRFRTPYIAVLSMGLLGWACAMYSHFATLAAVSAIARILTYMATCATVPVLRRKMQDTPRGFSVPGGIVIPIAAIALSAWLLLGSTTLQVEISAAVLCVGLVLHFWMRRRRPV